MGYQGEKISKMSKINAKSLIYAWYVKQFLVDFFKCKSVCGKVFYVSSDMTTASKLFHIKSNRNDFPK